jgi:hypothetical protein
VYKLVYEGSYGDALIEKGHGDELSNHLYILQSTKDQCVELAPLASQ